MSTGDHPQPELLERKAGRIYELDSLRGLAALFVMWSHFTQRYQVRFPELNIPDLPHFFSSQFAVHLFFMISGFVIFMTVQRSHRVRDFAVNRFGRLYPLYWTVVLTTTAIAVLLHAYDDDIMPTVGQTLANLTMAHTYFGVKAIDTPYWTLMVELAFYVWMGLLMYVGWLRRIELIAWCWLGICLAAYGVQVMTETKWPYAVQFAGLFQCAPLFLSGIMFYRIRHGQHTKWTHVLIAACLVVYVAVLVRPTLALGIRHTAVVLALYSAFYLFAYDRLTILALRPLIFLGTISYSLYIIHNRPGYLLMHTLQIKGGVPYPVALPLTIAACIGAATLLTFGVERPANRWVRRYWGHRTKREVEQEVPHLNPAHLAEPVMVEEPGAAARLSDDASASD